MTIVEKISQEIKMNTEWLYTTENDEVECISIENLERILLDNFKIEFNIRTENGKL